MPSKVTYVIRGDDVTGEVLDLAVAVAAEWPDGQDKGIHWAKFWEALNGAHLSNGTELQLGGTLGTEAMFKIKDHVLSH